MLQSSLKKAGKPQLVKICFYLPDTAGVFKFVCRGLQKHMCLVV